MLQAQNVSILPNSVQTICVGGTVNFNVNLNGINPATVQGYSWTFEGGTPANSNIQNPSVVYNTPQANPYNVQLTVTFNNGTGAQTVNVPMVQLFSVQSPINVTPVTCHGGSN